MLVIPCHCPGLPRLLYGEGRQYIIDDMDVTGFSASWDRYFRICPSESGEMSPRITNVECLNYDIEDLTVTVTFQSYPGIYPECGPDIFEPLGGASWQTDFPPTFESFTFPPGDGAFVAVLFSANVGSGFTPFGDPPILRVSYSLDPVP